MLNPMPPVKPPTATEKIATSAGKIVKVISRNRELAIAILFLVLGFIGGKM